MENTKTSSILIFNRLPEKYFRSNCSNDLPLNKVIYVISTNSYYFNTKKGLVQFQYPNIGCTGDIGEFGNTGNTGGTGSSARGDTGNTGGTGITLSLKNRIKIFNDVCVLKYTYYKYLHFALYLKNKFKDPSCDLCRIIHFMRTGDWVKIKKHKCEKTGILSITDHCDYSCIENPDICRRQYWQWWQDLDPKRYYPDNDDRKDSVEINTEKKCSDWYYTADEDETNTSSSGSEEPPKPFFNDLSCFNPADQIEKFPYNAKWNPTVGAVQRCCNNRKIWPPLTIKQDIDIQENKVFIYNHNLNTKDIILTVYDSKLHKVDIHSEYIIAVTKNSIVFNTSFLKYFSQLSDQTLADNYIILQVCTVTDWIDQHYSKEPFYNKNYSYCQLGNQHTLYPDANVLTYHKDHILCSTTPPPPRTTSNDIIYKITKQVIPQLKDNLNIKIYKFIDFNGNDITYTLNDLELSDSLSIDENIIELHQNCNNTIPDANSGYLIYTYENPTIPYLIQKDIRLIFPFVQKYLVYASHTLNYHHILKHFYDNKNFEIKVKIYLKYSNNVGYYCLTGQKRIKNVKSTLPQRNLFNNIKNIFHVLTKNWQTFTSKLIPLFFIPKNSHDVSILIESDNLANIQLFTTDGCHLLGTLISNQDWAYHNINNSNINSDFICFKCGNEGFRVHSQYYLPGSGRLSGTFNDGSKSLNTFIDLNSLKTSSNETIYSKSHYLKIMKITFSGNGNYLTLTNPSIDTSEYTVLNYQYLNINYVAEDLFLFYIGEGNCKIRFINDVSTMTSVTYQGNQDDLTKMPDPIFICHLKPDLKYIEQTDYNYYPHNNIYEQGKLNILNYNPDVECKNSINEYPTYFIKQLWQFPWYVSSPSSKIKKGYCNVATDEDALKQVENGINIFYDYRFICDDSMIEFMFFKYQSYFPTNNVSTGYIELLYKNCPPLLARKRTKNDIDNCHDYYYDPEYVPLLDESGKPQIYTGYVCQEAIKSNNLLRNVRFGAEPPRSLLDGQLLQEDPDKYDTLLKDILQSHNDDRKVYTIKVPKQVDFLRNNYCNKKDPDLEYFYCFELYSYIYDICKNSYLQKIEIAHNPNDFVSNPKYPHNIIKKLQDNLFERFQFLNKFCNRKCFVLQKDTNRIIHLNHNLKIQPTDKYHVVAYHVDCNNKIYRFDPDIIKYIDENNLNIEFKEYSKLNLCHYYEEIPDVFKQKIENNVDIPTNYLEHVQPFTILGYHHLPKIKLTSSLINRDSKYFPDNRPDLPDSRYTGLKQIGDSSYYHLANVLKIDSVLDQSILENLFNIYPNYSHTGFLRNNPFWRLSPANPNLYDTVIDTFTNYPFSSKQNYRMSLCNDKVFKLSSWKTQYRKSCTGAEHSLVSRKYYTVDCDDIEYDGRHKSNINWHILPKSWTYPSTKTQIDKKIHFNFKQLFTTPFHSVGIKDYSRYVGVADKFWKTGTPNFSDVYNYTINQDQGEFGIVLATYPIPTNDHCDSVRALILTFHHDSFSTYLSYKEGLNSSNIIGRNLEYVRVLHNIRSGERTHECYDSNNHRYITYSYPHRNYTQDVRQNNLLYTRYFPSVANEKLNYISQSARSNLDLSTTNTFGNNDTVRIPIELTFCDIHLFKNTPTLPTDYKFITGFFPLDYQSNKKKVSPDFRPPRCFTQQWNYYPPLKPNGDLYNSLDVDETGLSLIKKFFPLPIYGLYVNELEDINIQYHSFMNKYYNDLYEKQATQNSILYKSIYGKIYYLLDDIPLWYNTSFDVTINNNHNFNIKFENDLGFKGEFDIKLDPEKYLHLFNFGEETSSKYGFTYIKYINSEDTQIFEKHLTTQDTGYAPASYDTAVYPIWNPPYTKYIPKNCCGTECNRLEKISSIEITGEEIKLFPEHFLVVGHNIGAIYDSKNDKLLTTFKINSQYCSIEEVLADPFFKYDIQTVYIFNFNSYYSDFIDLAIKAEYLKLPSNFKVPKHFIQSENKDKLIKLFTDEYCKIHHISNRYKYIYLNAPEFEQVCIETCPKIKWKRNLVDTDLSDLIHITNYVQNFKVINPLTDTEYPQYGERDELECVKSEMFGWRSYHRKLPTPLYIIVTNTSYNSDRALENYLKLEKNINFQCFQLTKHDIYNYFYSVTHNLGDSDVVNNNTYDIRIYDDTGRQCLKDFDFYVFKNNTIDFIFNRSAIIETEPDKFEIDNIEYLFLRLIKIDYYNIDYTPLYYNPYDLTSYDPDYSSLYEMVEYDLLGQFEGHFIDINTIPDDLKYYRRLEVNIKKYRDFYLKTCSGCCNRNYRIKEPHLSLSNSEITERLTTPPINIYVVLEKRKCLVNAGTGGTGGIGILTKREKLILTGGIGDTGGSGRLGGTGGTGEIGNTGGTGGTGIFVCNKTGDSGNTGGTGGGVDRFDPFWFGGTGGTGGTGPIGIQAIYYRDKFGHDRPISELTGDIGGFGATGGIGFTGGTGGTGEPYLDTGGTGGTGSICDTGGTGGTGEIGLQGVETEKEHFYAQNSIDSNIYAVFQNSHINRYTLKLSFNIWVIRFTNDYTWTCSTYSNQLAYKQNGLPPKVQLFANDLNNKTYLCRSISNTESIFELTSTVDTAFTVFDIDSYSIADATPIGVHDINIELLDAFEQKNYDPYRIVSKDNKYFSNNLNQISFNLNDILSDPNSLTMDSFFVQDFYLVSCLGNPLGYNFPSETYKDKLYKYVYNLDIANNLFYIKTIDDSPLYTYLPIDPISKTNVHVRYYYDRDDEYFDFYFDESLVKQFGFMMMNILFITH